MASIAARLPIDRVLIDHGLIDDGLIDDDPIDRKPWKLISEARRQIFEK